MAENPGAICPSVNHHRGHKHGAGGNGGKWGRPEVSASASTLQMVEPEVCDPQPCPKEYCQSAVASGRIMSSIGSPYFFMRNFYHFQPPNLMHYKKEGWIWAGLSHKMVSLV